MTVGDVFEFPHFIQSLPNNLYLTSRGRSELNAFSEGHQNENNELYMLFDFNTLLEGHQGSKNIIMLSQIRTDILYAIPYISETFELRNLIFKKPSD